LVPNIRAGSKAKLGDRLLKADLTSAGRELRFGWDEARGGRFEGERSRRAVRAFKEKYDDGRCKVGCKLVKSSEYKEKIKQRP
jgi:hypothetical protein